VVLFVERAAAAWARQTPTKRTPHQAAEWVKNLDRRDVETLLRDGVTAADRFVEWFSRRYAEKLHTAYQRSPEDHSAAAEVVRNARSKEGWTDGEWAKHWAEWHLATAMNGRAGLGRLRLDVRTRQAEMGTPGTVPRPTRGRLGEGLQQGADTGAMEQF